MSNVPNRVITSSLFLLSSTALWAVAGCSKSEAAPARGSSIDSQVGAARTETENFIAEMTATGPYTAGAEGRVEVTLTPKGAYHTNPQYPYKFKLVDPAPAGVTFPKPILQRADGTFEEKRARFKVPFVAAKAGSVKVAGTLFMSVCSEANCVMDKVPLDVDVDVK